MRVDLFLPFRDAALLAEIAGGTLTVYGHPIPPRGVSVDSRLVRAGDLFAALPGRERQGRDFISSALERGASAVLTDELPEKPAVDCAVMTVPDVSEALLNWAAYRRQKTRAKVIGVSGSAGKTTTKEGLYHLCRTVGSVSYTAGNYNSTVGMPLSVLSFEETDFWIVEIGVNHPGEMAPMAKALVPDLAVLTNVGHAHIGYYKDRTELLAEKAKLAAFMREDGVLMIPSELKEDLPPVPPRTMTFGGDGDFQPSRIRQSSAGVTLTVSGRGRVLDDLFWPLPGPAGTAQLLRLAAVGIMLEMDDENIRRGIASAGQNTPRLRRFAVGERLLIDDTYNASPEAMTAALETLRYIAGSRPAVAVLGDMYELGDQAAALHEAIGEAAARAGLHRLYCCGRYGEMMAAGARRGGFQTAHIVCADTVNAGALVCELMKNTPHDAVILFKAGHAAGLGGVVDQWRHSEA